MRDRRDRGAGERGRLTTGRRAQWKALTRRARRGKNAEAFLNFHREIVLTMKASFTLRTYLMSEDTRKSAMKNKNAGESFIWDSSAFVLTKTRLCQFVDLNQIVK